MVLVGLFCGDGMVCVVNGPSQHLLSDENRHLVRFAHFVANF